MAPDTFSFEPESDTSAVHRDRLGELRDRLTQLQAESDRIARSFVQLHSLRSSICTPEADLIERVDQIVQRHEADIIKTHGLLHDAARLLDETETLWARQMMHHIPSP